MDSIINILFWVSNLSFIGWRIMEYKFHNVGPIIDVTGQSLKNGYSNYGCSQKTREKNGGAGKLKAKESKAKTWSRSDKCGRSKDVFKPYDEIGQNLYYIFQNMYSNMTHK